MFFLSRKTFVFCFILALLVNLIYSQAVFAVNSGPLYFWSFDDGTADDGSGNGLNGLIFNTIQQDESSCAVGKCFGFDGNKSHISINNFSQPGPAGTFMAWVYANSGEIDGLIISSHFYINWLSGSIAVDIRTANGWAQGAGGFNLGLGLAPQQWHHLAVVKQSGTTAQVYVNGVLRTQITTQTGNLSSFWNPAEIGKYPGDPDGNARHFNGRIDEIKVFDFALANAQIKAEADKKFIGASCNSGDTCVSGLECDTTEKKCIPTVENRKIGAFCTVTSHCDTREGFLKLSCNKDSRFCVAASRGVSCADEAVNQSDVFGKTEDTISPPYRCDTSLFCGEDGECGRDLGGEFVEEIGVGESTEDIRDQIRRVINIALGFLGVIGVIIVIYGGVLWMTAMGEDEKVEKGKKTIISGLIGIAFIAIAWTIVSYILNVTQGVG